MGWGRTPARRGVPGPGMESLGTALVLLVQFWGATGLRVQQEPEWLRATPGSRVTLACQVLQSQVWERLRVVWVKDSVPLCEPHITNGSLSLEACGPRGQLSWTPPGNLTLRLDHVSPKDSGDYVCSVAVEIPSLNQKQGNGTLLLVEKDGGSPYQTSTDAGLPVAPLVAGGVAVAAIALSAWVWGRCRSRREDSAHHLYGNVLYQPRGAPKKTKAGRAEGTVLDIPREDQKSQSFYPISFPQPPSPQQRLAQKTCPSPRSSHPVSTARVSPDARPSGQQRPGGLLEVGRRLETPEKTSSHQRPRENVTDFPKSQGVPQPSPRPPPHYCNAGPLPHPRSNQ
ncbi:transmembrane and immunoglobulin domain-containing protein 2 isoform X1 [Mustela lutreola]|uniref:transmembrane and immunoglobulin domain-containing protein 2 isoform X1 n=1 Tax=Mustela lutreola TaxID=9666 RepID=UPI0027979489|nr:transmembrane and immunoglobulin domain-containing protein 2 isoform X1 [Mustela lutreola]